MERIKRKDGLKRQYISYGYRSVAEEGSINDKETKRGVVMHVDQELRELLLGGQDEEFGEDY